MAGKANALVQEMRRLEAKDIKKQLHVNEALSKQYHLHLSNFQKDKPVPCCALYDSPAFNAIGFQNFDDDTGEWANTYCRIFSGLYGIVRPYDEIQALSLPVALHTKLKNSKGNYLRDYWQEAIIKELEDGLKQCPIPVIVNLANEMDHPVLDKELLPEGTRILTLEFKSFGKKGKTKDLSNEATGEFVRWAMENRVMSIDEILEYRGYGVEEGGEAEFRLHDASTNQNSDKIVFEQATQDGGDANWKKKMSESGLTAGKFVKEFASGKNKYKRTEMNKALAKDQKQKRGQYAVH